MRTDYKAAKKLADESVAEAKKAGKPPYLPMLDAREDVNNSLKVVKLV